MFEVVVVVISNYELRIMNYELTHFSRISRSSCFPNLRFCADRTGGARRFA